MSAQSTSFIHGTALVETSQIGEGTRIWAFAHIMNNVTVGRNCNIGDHVFIESKVTIGDNVTIKNGVSIWEHVNIDANVFIGPNAVFTNDCFPRSRTTNWQASQTWLEEGVTVGANATILCGLRLGRRSFIGAGSVVTKDVAPHALVFGNPARQHGWVCFCAQKLLPDALGVAVCHQCKRTYSLSDAGVVLQR